MKKIYRHLLVVSVALSGLYILGWSVMPEGSFVDRSFATVAYPFVCVKKRMTNAYEAVIQFVDVQRHNEQICLEYQKKYEDLQAQYVALLGAATTWDDCKEIIQFGRRYSSDFALTVSILSKHFSDTEHYYLVEGGKNRSIAPDMVVVYKNCLVGRVSQVYDWYSKVTLITDPQCKVAALCRTSLDRGIHEGVGSLSETRLSYVFDTQMDLEKRLQKGDFVISSGEGLVFPKGFGIGTITDYKKNDLRIDITIKPLLNMKQLNYCCIIAQGSELREADFAGTLIVQPEKPADVLIKKLEATSSVPVVQNSKPEKQENTNSLNAADAVVTSPGVSSQNHEAKVEVDLPAEAAKNDSSNVTEIQSPVIIKPVSDIASNLEPQPPAAS